MFFLIDSISTDTPKFNIVNDGNVIDEQKAL